MRPNLAALAAVLLVSGAAAQSSRDGERPPRPEGASNAAIGGWCDALTGAKKDDCLREERRREQEKAAQDERRGTRGSCDALIGPERARCLSKGGSIEVRTQGGASAGGTGQRED